MEIPLTRCSLRSLTAEDAAVISPHANNRKVWRNLRDAFPHPYSQADAKQFIERVRAVVDWLQQSDVAASAFEVLTAAALDCFAARRIALRGPRLRPALRADRLLRPRLGGHVLRRALGRSREARTAWRRAKELNHPLAGIYLFIDHTLAGEHDAARAELEAAYEKAGKDSSRVAALISAARAPETRYASTNAWAAEAATQFNNLVGAWWIYTAFGMHDELFDHIESTGPGDAIWTDADNIIGSVSIFRDSGIMAHPGYLATMKLIGAKDLWEERGAPDFCSKESGQWVCR